MEFLGIWPGCAQEETQESGRAPERWSMHCHEHSRGRDGHMAPPKREHPQPSLALTVMKGTDWTVNVTREPATHLPHVPVSFLNQALEEHHLLP